MITKDRERRSAGELVLAAAPWIAIFLGITGLVSMLVISVWPALGPWPAEARGGSGAVPAEGFTQDLPEPAGPSSPVAPVSVAAGPVRTSPAAVALTVPSAAAPARETTAPSRETTATAAPTTATAKVSRNAYVTVQAESFDGRSGVTVETCGEGGRDITGIASGDWVRYDDVDFGSSGPIDMLARVASGVGGGASGLVQIRLDSVSGTPIGDFAVDNTGGWQTWRSVPGNVAAATGVHTVYLTFSSAQSADYLSVNWFVFRH